MLSTRLKATIRNTYRQIADGLSKAKHPLIISGTTSETPALLDAAIAALPQETRTRYTVLKSAPFYLELLDKRVNKGTGVQALAEVLGLKPENVMAIGDQENDMAMLHYAGTGVAMGNAIDAVKAVADFVTKTNGEDGVAHAIKHFVLG